MVERKGDIPNLSFADLVPAKAKITGIPDTIGDNRYRVWTVRHGISRHSHSTGPGGWHLVTVDGWHANPSREVWNKDRGGWDTLPGDQVQISIFRPQPTHSERHPEMDNQRFDNVQDAYDAIWAAGLVGLMISDDNAEARRTLLPAAIAYENDEQAAGRLAAADRKTNPQTRTWVYA